MRKRLLVVGDEPGLRSEMVEGLSTRDYQVAEASDPACARRMLEKEPFDLVILDLNVSMQSVSDLVNRLGRLVPTTLIMIISSGRDLHQALETFRAGACDYLIKPFSLQLLYQKIQHALFASEGLYRRTGMRLEMHRQDASQTMVFGRSQKSLALLGNLYRLSRMQKPVLITGEAGTGKRLAARLLHAWSRAGASKLLTLEATRIAADQARKRLLRFFAQYDMDHFATCAGPDTLLIENIHMLPQRLQRLLCKSIRDTEQRSGMTQLPRSGNRLLIATALLDADTIAVRDRQILQSLHGCVSSVLHLPSLREHLHDLPCITDHFLTQIRQAQCKPVLGVDSEAMRCLMSYTWPGNLVELRAVLEAGVRRCERSHLGLADLPDYLSYLSHTPRPNSRYLLH